MQQFADAPAEHRVGWVGRRQAQVGFLHQFGSTAAGAFGQAAFSRMVRRLSPHALGGSK
jgi:hypothetical protein